ncbi:MAG: tRNA pseudouridine(55) synthase TruB [Polyangia bacterium]
MHGVLVVDKPEGVTSFDVVARARRALGVRRIGHAGTLDPLATGVLVLCVGEATKLVPYLMDADKEYRATACLGVTTDTDDAAPGSRVVARAPAAALRALDRDSVAAAFAGQVGLVRQRPPAFSALKVDGERLYDRARRARDQADAELEAEVASQAAAKERPVRIDGITLDALRLCPELADADAEAGAAVLPEMTFTVRCGKGTYIRSLARDVGERLGVGAHLTALRRLRVGAFTVERAVALAELVAGRVGPAQLAGLAAAIAHLPVLHVDAESARRLRQGLRTELAALSDRLEEARAQAPAAPVAVLDPQGGLVAVLERAPGGDSAGPSPGPSSWQIGRGFNGDPGPGADPGADGGTSPDQPRQPAAT